MEYTIKWLEDKTRLKELVDFFMTHKTDSYISHGEILSGRADDSHHWSTNLESILSKQFNDDFNGEDSTTKLKILIAEKNDGTMIGMVVFHIINSGFKNYAVLEDMLLDHSIRGQSIGSKLLETAIDESKHWGISLMLLESGIDNHGAHHFFEKYGFKKVSENYILPL